MNSKIGISTGNQLVSIKLSDHKGLIKRLVEKLRQFLRDPEGKEIHKKAGRFVNSNNPQEKINIYQYFEQNAADLYKDKFSVKLNNNELSLRIGTEEQKITLDEDQTAMLTLVKKEEDFLSTLQSFYEFNNKENTPKKRENAFFKLRDMSGDENKERFDLNIEDNDHLSLSIKLPGYPVATQEKTIKTTLKIGAKESDVTSIVTTDINEIYALLKGPETEHSYSNKQKYFDFWQVKLDFDRDDYSMEFSDKSMLLSEKARENVRLSDDEHTYLLDATKLVEVLKNKLVNISDKQRCAINIMLTQTVFPNLMKKPRFGKEPILMSLGKSKAKYVMKQLDNDTFEVTVVFNKKLRKHHLEVIEEGGSDAENMINRNGGRSKQRVQMDFLLKGDQVICLETSSKNEYLPGYPMQKSAKDYSFSQKV